MPETASATARRFKIVDDLEGGLDDGDDDQLCDTITGFDAEVLISTIPAGDEQLSLVI